MSEVNKPLSKFISCVYYVECVAGAATTNIASFFSHKTWPIIRITSGTHRHTHVRTHHEYIETGREKYTER